MILTNSKGHVIIQKMFYIVICFLALRFSKLERIGDPTLMTM